MQELFKSKPPESIIDGVIEVIREISPEIAQDLVSVSASTVRSYAEYLFRPTVAPQSQIGMKARTLMFERLGHSDIRLDPLRSVIQTSTHSQMFLDDATFYTIFLTWLGVRYAGLDNFLMFNSSTVTLEASPKKGPGWQSSSDTKIPVFSLSRKALSKTSVCALRIDGLSVNYMNWLYERGMQMPVHLGASEGAPLRSATTVFNDANRELLNIWAEGFGPKPWFIQDDWVAALVADHVENETLLHRFLFCEARRTRLLALLDAEKAAPRSGPLLPRSTDLFWLLDRGRVKPLRVIDDNLVSKDGDSVFAIRPREILEGLRTGILLPDLFLIFVVIGLLPAVRVLGGPRQMGYVSIFNRILRNALDETIADEKEFLADFSKTFSHGWSMRIIDSALPVASLLARVPAPGIFKELENWFGEVSIADASGGFLRIKNHVSWIDKFMS